MQAIKIFVCSKLTGDMTCSYAIASADEVFILDSAAAHEYEEHGHEDTPEFREKIRESLIETSIT